jgi:hypothetical protein
VPDSVEERVAFERATLAAEAQKQADAFTAEEDRIRAANGLSDAARKAALARIGEARIASIITTMAEEELQQRERARAQEDAEDEVHKALLDAQIAELQAQADMAVTSAERAKIEREILHLRQVEQLHQQGVDLSRQVIDGKKTQDQADQIFAAGEDQRATERQALIYKQWYEPVHSAIDAAVRGGWPGLVDYMKQRLEMGLIDALSNAFASALSNGNPLAAAGGGGNPFASLISAGLSLLGFASGGSPPVGQPYVVGENGPEIRIDKAPGSILNNSVLQALARSGGPRAGMAQSVVVNQFNLSGAVVTQDLLNQMNAVNARQTLGILAHAHPTFVRDARDATLQAISRRQALKVS